MGWASWGGRGSYSRALILVPSCPNHKLRFSKCPLGFSVFMQQIQLTHRTALNMSCYFLQLQNVYTPVCAVAAEPRQGEGVS